MQNENTFTFEQDISMFCAETTYLEIVMQQTHNWMNMSPK